MANCICFFLIIIIFLRIYDGTRDHQMVGEFGYILLTVIILFTCTTGILGVIGKAIILNFYHQSRNICPVLVHTASFLASIFFSYCLLS